jgi:hypothetical protein
VGLRIDRVWSEVDTGGLMIHVRVPWSSHKQKATHISTELLITGSLVSIAVMIAKKILTGFGATGIPQLIRVFVRGLRTCFLKLVRRSHLLEIKLRCNDLPGERS